MVHQTDVFSTFFSSADLMLPLKGVLAHIVDDGCGALSAADVPLLDVAIASYVTDLDVTKSNIWSHRSGCNATEFEFNIH